MSDARPASDFPAIDVATATTPVVSDQAASLASFPALSVVSGLLVDILAGTQAVKSKRYKDKCIGLIIRCVLFLQHLAAGIHNPVRLPETYLFSAVEQIERVLEQLKADVVNVASPRFFHLVLPHKTKEVALNEYDSILDNVWRSFDTVSLRQMSQFLAHLVPQPGQAPENLSSVPARMLAVSTSFLSDDDRADSESAAWPARVPVDSKTPPDVPFKPLWLRSPAVYRAPASPTSDESSLQSNSTLVSATASDCALQHPIIFNLDGEYPGFVNGSLHPVVHEEKEYPTAEHLYQAHGFLHAENVSRVADVIRCQPTASEAIEAAELRHRNRRHDWLQVRLSLMDSVLQAKFTQHPALRAALLATGDRRLVYECAADPFWGTTHDGSGYNELGKALVRLRETLRLQSPAVFTPYCGGDTSWKGPIRFRPNGEYPEFLNSSPHNVTQDGKQYRTAEHLYQASRFIHSAPQVDMVRIQRTAMGAIEQADSMKDKQRRDWKKVRAGVLGAVLETKFLQHPDLRATLLSTGNRQLIYDCSSDEYLGIGARGKGQNEHGKALMRVRDMLRTREQLLGLGNLGLAEQIVSH